MEKALFWDFDGTLIHPNESFLDALNSIIKEFGYDISEDEIRCFLRKACTWYSPNISYIQKTNLKWWERLFQYNVEFFKQHKIPKSFHQDINNCFRKRILDYQNYTLYEETNAVLSSCIEKGYANYILSNNFPELPHIIYDLGLSIYFTDYIISSNIGYEKPRIELFQYAMSVANFPECCYMIGDNPIADILGAKNSGIKTILVHTKSDSEADWTCGNLSEILLILP